MSSRRFPRGCAGRSHWRARGILEEVEDGAAVAVRMPVPSSSSSSSETSEVRRARRESSRYYMIILLL